MTNFNVATENIKEHNLYRIIGRSRSGNTNSLFNLISQQPQIDKIYLYVKDPYEAKYKFLINKSKSAGLKHFNDSKSFI